MHTVVETDCRQGNRVRRRPPEPRQCRPGHVVLATPGPPRRVLASRSAPGRPDARCRRPPCPPPRAAAPLGRGPDASSAPLCPPECPFRRPAAAHRARSGGGGTRRHGAVHGPRGAPLASPCVQKPDVRRDGAQAPVRSPDEDACAVAQAADARRVRDGRMQCAPPVGEVPEVAPLVRDRPSAASRDQNFAASAREGGGREPDGHRATSQPGRVAPPVPSSWANSRRVMW